MSETPDKSKLRDILQNTHQSSQGHQKQSLRNCHSLRSCHQGDMVTKCNAIFWMEQWKRKKGHYKNTNKIQIGYEI